jgi:hypothetical protein
MAIRALCSTGPLACLNLGAPTRPSVPRPPNGHSLALKGGPAPLRRRLALALGRNEPASKSPSVTFAFR